MYKSVKLNKEGYFTGAYMEGTDKELIGQNGTLVDEFPSEENKDLWIAYKLVDGEWIVDVNKLSILKATLEEKTNLDNIMEQIEQTKQELSSLDYKTMKFIDGELTLEEYAETKLKKKDLRKIINDLEKRIKQ